MNASLYSKDLEPHRTDGPIEIFGIVSENRTFRIYKAGKGTKYVILKTSVSPDAMTREMLRREYELSCDLHHPCIARTLGFEEDTPVGPAILMEYVEGGNLNDFIASNPTQSRRKAVFQDILDGVDYLHHRGIIHNDLKPENIIVTETGAARILDFGLSASHDSIYRGCLGGTGGYTAPEILRGEKSAGPASDIYSIGVLMGLLFGGKTYRRIARKCTDADPVARPRDIGTLRSLIQRRDRMPFAVAAAVGICLAVVFPTLMFSGQKAEMEERIEERVASYSENRADSLERQKKQRTEALRRHYESVLKPSWQRTMKKISGQQYREVAQVFTISYYNLAIPYMDSICRRFTMLPDGTVPDENTIIGEVFSEYHLAINSALNKLPSIYSQPPAQRDSMLRVVEKVSRQEGLPED